MLLYHGIADKLQLSHLSSWRNSCREALCYWIHRSITGALFQPFFFPYHDGYHFLVYCQPGEARRAEATIEQIEDQLRIAAQGVEAPLKEAQTATGIRDQIASKQAEALLHLGRIVFKDQKLSKKEKKEKMGHMDEVLGELTDEAFCSPFLTFDGEWNPFRI